MGRDSRVDRKKQGCPDRDDITKNAPSRKSEAKEQQSVQRKHRRACLTLQNKGIVFLVRVDLDKIALIALIRKHTVGRDRVAMKSRICTCPQLRKRRLFGV